MSKTYLKTVLALAFAARRLARVGALPLLLGSAVFAAEEGCATCGAQLSVSGDFTHHKEAPTLAIEGAGPQAEAFREDVNGTNFTVEVNHLPAGTYLVEVRAVETQASKAGERVFTVSAGEVVLAKDVDLFAAAGGVGKVALVAGVVEKADDTLRGPLRLQFQAVKGRAKFCTIQVSNAEGKTVAFVRASELADAFSAVSMRVPEVVEPACWRDAQRPLEVRVNDLIRRMSLAEKVAQLKNAAPGISRLGLPAFDYWNEALHGVANNGVATVFPQAIGAAASWNPELIREEGHIIGVEGRAKYNEYATTHNGDSKWWTGLTFWTPNINIFRDPRWGRGQETFGEDPFLTGEIGVAFVRGLQGEDPRHMLAMACAKHFAVHSGPEPERHRFDAEVSESDLRDTYLPQFERVVREGKVGGVMSAYNRVNGVPATASARLLRDVLRKEWGFDGYVVSDCGAVQDIYATELHHYVKSPEEAAALAVKAGCNLCCGGDYNALVRAVQQGLVTEAEIEEALYHTLWTRFRLGLFDATDEAGYNRISLADNATPEHGQVALRLARQSIVLLKNDGLLPLDRAKYTRIAVIGPNADSRSMLEGNYHGTSAKPVSILSGIRAVAGVGVEILHAYGSPITSRAEVAPWSAQDNTTTRPVAELKAEALAVAAKADLIVYVGGLTPAQEGECLDRETIELPAEQENLVRALHALGKPVVMVNCSGSAMALPWEAEKLPAILQAWYPGQSGGQAVAEVLFGEVNPSGHLPVTFYRATTELPAFGDYSMRGRSYRYYEGKPLWAFGHGLSYSRFELTKAKLEKSVLVAGESLRLSFCIRNDSGREGDDVVQVYYRQAGAWYPRPRQALCAFSRVSLRPGELRTLTVEIPLERIRRWDTATRRYEVEPGAYELLVGEASDKIRLACPFRIDDGS